MRIAVNTRLLLKGRLEGIGWYAYHTLRRLAERHPEHEFIFLFDRPYDESFVFGPNVTPVTMGPPSRHPVLFYLWFEWTVPYLLKKYKADVFLSPDGQSTLSTKVPVCLVMHDISYEHYPEFMSLAQRLYFRHYAPRFARAARRLVTVSEFSKNDIATRYRVSPDKIDVSCNGAHEAYRPLSWEEREAAKEKWAGGHEYFVFAGALQPRKNVLNLLKAFVRFKKKQRSDMKLVIAGRLAWKYEEVVQYREQMLFKDDVVWLGYCEMDDLATIIGGAYALVYPSLFEGFGIPILEALQCGVPAVVSNTSSMPEVGGDAALLCDPLDPVDIALQMERIYKDEALRTQLIAAAPAQTTKYTWDHAADVLWEAVLKTAVGKK
jgi:glycosyltransferase involved in cell wall biosynthesis